jgi:hypothetical protein
MARASRELPSVEQVWQRIRDYAAYCKQHEVRLFTLQRFVANTITQVGDAVIERHSKEGTSQSAHIRRGDVERVWTELCTNPLHEASTKGDPRVFTHALMLAAMPRRIEERRSGVIGLVGHRTPAPLPAFAAEEIDYSRRAGGRRGGGGEGPIHRGIRLHIHDDPNTALAGLPGGPWTSFATEYSLATQDRIDVVVRDREGRFVLIEVKPRLVSDREYEESEDFDRAIARAPYAQAAKYRAQWMILREIGSERLRCVVAAPEIPGELARRMAKDHGVESVAVAVPR